MSSLAGLKVATPSDVEILITRDFDAPRELVFQAMTKPEFVRRWLCGPPGWEMTVCEPVAEAGGVYRYTWKGPAGEAMSMHGVCREFAPPERIVNTEVFDMGCPAQAGEQLGTLILSADGARTKLALTVRFPSKQARDAAIAFGMEKGLAAGYERLDALLAA